MKASDTQLGTPQILYKNTKVAIEALTGVAEGAISYATDTNQFGSYTGSVWVWGQGAGDISGTGVAGRVAEFVTNTKTLQAAKLIAPAVNILTLTNAAAATLALNITAAKTLTLTVADNYTLTIPATGTAALLATANVFTAQQQITVPTTTLHGLILKTSDNNNTKDLLLLQNSSAGGLTKIDALGNVYMGVDIDISGNTLALPVLQTYARRTTANGAYAHVFNTATLANTTTESNIYFRALYNWVKAANTGTAYAIPTAMMNQATSYNTAPLSGLTGINNYVETNGSGTVGILIANQSGLSLYGTGAVDYGVLFDAQVSYIYADLTYLYGLRLGHPTLGNWTGTGTVGLSAGIWIENVIGGWWKNIALHTGKGIVEHGDAMTITGWQDLNQLKVTGHTTQTLPVGYLIDNTATTNVVRNVLQLETQSTGTAANGLGAGLLFSIETATAGTMQSAGRVYVVAIDNTNATRKYDLVGTAFDTAEREGIRIRADGARALIGIDTAAPTARLHLPAGSATANTAPLKFTSGALLTAVEAGAMEFFDNSLWFTNLAVRRTVTQSQEVIASTVTVGNTVTETTIYTVSHGANYLRVGKCEDTKMIGTVTSILGAGANTLTCRVKYAGATIATFVMPEANRTAVGFEIHVAATVRAIGAGTTSIQIHANMDIEGTTNDPIINTLATGLDSTTAQATTITLQWSDANAGNTISILQGNTQSIDDN